MDETYVAAIRHRRFSTGSGFPLMAASRAVPRLPYMDAEHSTQRVVVSFVGRPPVAQLHRASGVSEVEVDGPVVHCVVAGSFQPFLEALRGAEVITLQSTPVSCRQVEGEVS